MNPKPAAELALLDGTGRILLSERGKDPNKGKYDLPGGFVDLHDTAEAALLREIKEELDLDESDISVPSYFTSSNVPYHFMDELHQTLILVFVAQLKADKSKLLALDDVASIKWVNLKELDPEMLVSNEHYTYITNILQQN